MQLIKKKLPEPKPHPVIYEVNLTVDVEVVEAFDEWLHDHTQDMLAIPGFISANTSVVDDQNEKTRQRVVQYRLSDEAALAHYLEHDAERMRGKALEKFGENFTATRRVLSIAEAALAEQVTCANCGNELSGRFCQVCGQREEPRVPTLLSIASEATNAFLGLESKLWRTIALLLFRPGQLTVAYLSGKRQKYTSPLRLYLLFSIAAFAYFSFFGNLEMFNENITSSQFANQDASNQNTNTQDNLEDLLSDKENSLKVALPFLSSEANLNIEQKIKSVGTKIKKDLEEGNAEKVINHFINLLPKALLLFLPFIALAFKILYIGSGKYYIEHLIYLLHNHAFLFSILIGTAMMSELVDVYPWTESVLALTLLFGFLYYLGNYFYPPLRRLFTRSRIKSVIYSLVILGIMYGLLRLTMAQGITVVFAILWVFYIPYYIYRSMRVVYQYSAWVTIPSFVLMFMVYLSMFVSMLILSVAFAGYTYG